MKQDSRSPQFELGHWLSGWRFSPGRQPQRDPAPARRRKTRPFLVTAPLYRSFYWWYRVLSWFRYSLPRRLARPGLFAGTALAIAMVMLPDTENNVAYQAFALLAFIMLTGACFALVFTGRFSARRNLPRFATAGYPLKYTVTVENLTKHRQHGLELLEDLADPRPTYQEWIEVQLAEQRRVRSFRISGRRRSSFRRAITGIAPIPPLPPKGKAEALVQITPLRRGVLRFAGLSVARSDPLGLVRAFSRIKLPQSVLVLPRRYPLPPIALPGAMKYQQGGVALASSVGQSEEFVSLRDYRNGDPLRHIHWRTWAKVGRPVVKEFEDEFFVRHALVLDTFTDHPRSAAFEEAVSVAASFACTIQTQESLLDLLFVGAESYCFTSGRGLADADQMLEILATVRTCTEHPFRSLEHLVLSHISVVSGVICVLLAWDEPRREFLRKLQTLNVPLFVLVIVEPGRAAAVQPSAHDPERLYVLEAGRVEQQLMNLK